jgi:hypothetical protein
MKDDNVKRRTGAEMRAQRDQRLAEQRTTVQAGPMMEASRRADVIRAGLTNYAAIIDKIADAYQREDWKVLGYESFNAYAGGEFGEARLKLTPEQRAQILPAFLAVGMSKRGAAAALGVDDKTIRNDLRGADNSAPSKKSPLVSAMRQAIEEAGGTTAADVDNSSADGAQGPRDLDGRTHQPGTDPSAPGPSPVTPDTSPDGSLGGAPSGEAQDPSGDVHGVPSPEVQNSSERTPSTGLISDAPAARLPSSSLVAEQPGTEPPGDSGEEPTQDGAGTTVTSAARPPAGTGVSPVGDEVEDGDLAPAALSSTDPDVYKWMAVVDAVLSACEGLDYDVIGPMLTGSQMLRGATAVEEFTRSWKLLTQWAERD